MFCLSVMKIEATVYCMLILFMKFLESALSWNQQHQLKRLQYFIFSKRKRSRAVQSRPTDYSKRIRFDNVGTIVKDFSPVTGSHRKPLEKKKRMVSTSTQCDAVSLFVGRTICHNILGNSLFPKEACNLLHIKFTDIHVKFNASVKKS